MWRLRPYRGSLLTLLLNVALVASWTTSLFAAFSWLTLVCNLIALVSVGISLVGLVLNHRTVQLEREYAEIEAAREREAQQWYDDILAQVARQDGQREA
jgi:hypothetical protein